MELTVLVFCLTFFPFTNESVPCRNSFLNIAKMKWLIFLAIYFINWNDSTLQWHLPDTRFVYFFTHSVKWKQTPKQISDWYLYQIVSMWEHCVTLLASLKEYRPIRRCECWTHTLVSFLKCYLKVEFSKLKFTDNRRMRTNQNLNTPWVFKSLNNPWY